MAIILGVILLFIVLAYGLIRAYELGAFFFIPSILFTVGIYLALELWSNRYIAKFGTLTLIGTTKQGEPSDNDN